MSALHVDVVGASEAERTWLLLHGILGRGMNLRGVARALTENQNNRVILVDLPHHGQSVGADFESVRDVQGVANVVAEAMDGPIDVVVGHSFGGRVALWLEQQLKPRTTYLLDSPPGPRTDSRASQTTEAALAFLRSARESFPTRDAFTQGAVAHGLTESVALWLAMNLVFDAGQYRLGIDVSRIEMLLQSLFKDDAWGCVENAHGAMHFLVADRDSAFSEAESARLVQTQIAHPEKIFYHSIAAGHWLHADNPSAVLEILRRFDHGGAVGAER